MWAEEKVRNDILNNSNLNDGFVWSQDLRYLKSMKDYLRSIWVNEASQIIKKLLPEFEKKFQIITKCKQYAILLSEPVSREQVYSELKWTQSGREFCLLLQFLDNSFSGFSTMIDSKIGPQTEWAIFYFSNMFDVNWNYTNTWSNPGNLYKESNQKASKFPKMMNYKINYQKINDQMFLDYWWFNDFEQWLASNCYLLAAMKSLMIIWNDFWSTLMTTSIERTNTWWIVTLPLWEPDGKKIIINDEEMRINAWMLPKNNTLVSVVSAAYSKYISNKPDAPLKVSVSDLGNLWECLPILIWPESLYGSYTTWNRSNYDKNMRPRSYQVKGHSTVDMLNSIRAYNKDRVCSISFHWYSSDNVFNKDWFIPSFRPRWLESYYSGWHAYSIESVHWNIVNLRNPYKTDLIIPINARDLCNFPYTSLDVYKLNWSKMFNNRSTASRFKNWKRRYDDYDI